MATLEAKVPGQPRAVTSGEVLQTAQGAVASVTLHLTVPAHDYLDCANRIDRVELIGISSEGALVLFAGTPGSTEAFTVPVTRPAWWHRAPCAW